MLNLTPLLLRNESIDIRKKISMLWDPNLYLAENISDFQKEAEEIKMPWYKIGRILVGPRIYVIVQNVAIEEIINHPDWYLMHDDSGQKVIYWDEDHFLFPALSDPKSTLEQGSYFDVLFCYLYRNKVSYVTKVEEYSGRINIKKPESLADRIKSSFIREPAFEF